jgi:uncharacterized protein YdeI (YjbR/CyaY-like superfamily)
MTTDRDANKKVDDYFSNVDVRFSPICDKLRQIYLSEGLTEELKWGAPCYSHNGLVASIGAFKNHVGSWYFKGALLSDPNKRLRKAQKGTKGLRSLIFCSIEDLDETLIRDFVKEAMILNEKGIKVDTKKSRTLDIPEYFSVVLNQNAWAKETFENFSYSKKKEYIDWITSAKREETRANRIQESIQMLAEGKGKHDKYRK